MNGGFDPVVVNPSGFRVQRASQQTPFYFGGSQVPIHMATGGGIMRINRPPVLPPHLSKMRGGMLRPPVPPLNIAAMRKRQLMTNLNLLNRAYTEKYGGREPYMRSMKDFYDTAIREINAQDLTDEDVFRVMLEHIHQQRLNSGV